MTSTQYWLQNLLNSTIYYWRVKAHSIDKESAWSSVWNFKTFPLPLGVPNLISPNKNATNVDINPTLNWSSVNDATQYDVQLWKKSNSQMIVNTTVATTNHSGFTLEYSTEYEWKVRAKNSEQIGNWSSTFSFTTLPPTLPIVSTANATNIEVTTATVGGSVTGGSGTITTRGIKWGTSENNLSNTSTSGSGLGSFTINLTNLTHSTTYYYRAFATSEYGTGYGDIKSFKTKDAPPFTVTIGDKTTCKYQPIALGSDLKIDGGSGNFSYTWAPASLLDDGSKANPVFLNPTITRNFTLTVKDNVSNVLITKTISITVIETPAAAVTSYLSRKNSQPPFNLNTLVTTRTGQSPFVDKWYDVNFNELSNSVVDPPIGTTKYYHKLFDATGCASSYKLTTIYTTSGREIDEENIVNSNNYTFAASISPNPVSTSTELIVLFQQPTEVEISLIDMSGRTIYEEKFNNTSLELIHKFDFESYSPGVYLIQIKSIDDIANIKFVKY